MTEPSAKRASTQVSKIIKAPRKAVYQAFLDPDAVASWRRPENMKGHVHVFEAREGGSFRMSLTYQDPEQSPGGKTSEDTDTFQADLSNWSPTRRSWKSLSSNRGTRPEIRKRDKNHHEFTDTDEGTEITVLCQDIPAGIRAEDNEMGCKSSLQNLAALIE